MSIINSLIHTAVAAGGFFSKNKHASEIPAADFVYRTDPKAERFSVGFGKAVILPDDIEEKTYYIAGYGENNPARGVIDPQYASALWLDDHADNGGVLLISLDIVGLLRKDVERLKKHLAAFRLHTGCGAITVMSTHNHAGIDTMGLWGPLPFSGKNPKFMELLFAAAEKAANEAYAQKKSGRLYYGKIEVPDLQEDIRTPEVFSKILTRFRFVPDDGGKETWFLNFAAHCESLQGCNHLVSADYPCYLREHIRKNTGAETFYAVGAVGGMISMNIPEEDLLRKEHRLLESTRRIGERLAEYAINIKDEKELHPRISRITQPFYVEVENSLLSVAGQIGIIDVDRYYLPAPAVKTQLTYMEIDSVPMLFLPCELFPELAYGGYLSAAASGTGKGPEINPTPLCDIIGNKDTVIFGLSDDELGYVIPPNDFFLHPEKPYLEKGIDAHERRHYEETNSAGPQTARIIADTLTKVMETVNRKKASIGQ